MQYRRARTKGATFFFTVVTHQRKRILCHEANIRLIKEALQHVINQHPFKIDAFVLLPDHIHCIWTLLQDDNDFSIRWRLIKTYFSRRCQDKYKGIPYASRLSKGEQAVWQRRFWEHQIRDERDFSAHCDYIHYNPVKHGLVTSPNDWPYSTFHRFVKQGIYPIEWGTSEMEFSDGIGRE